MKRFLSALLIFTIICSLLQAFSISVVFSADDAEDSQWKYEEFIYGELTGLVLNEYLGTKTDIYVPAEIDGKPVLKLGNGIFQNNDSVNSITMSANIRVIGDNAFYDADALVCIVTNNALTEIGAGAFYSCDSFNSIILTDEVTAISNNVFTDCSKLIIYCNKGSAAYNYATAFGIDYVVLSSDATYEIATYESLDYYIQNGEARLIGYTKTLANPVIPAVVNGYPVTSVTGAFKNSDIKSVSLPASIKNIGDETFSNCRLLTNVNLPSGITSIGEKAFYKCPVLTGITIPEGVTTIGDYAFDLCDKLAYADIPKSVTSIGTRAFGGCYELASISIPEGVTVIKERTFQSCKKLTNVKIPGTVKVIEDAAFYDCSALSDVTLGEGITEIKDQAFFRCSITDIILPESITSIGADTFFNCQIKYIKIPENVNNLQLDSFSDKTLFIAKENSFAHSFAKDNSLLYFAVTEGEETKQVTTNGITYLIGDTKAAAIDCNSSVTHAVIPEKIEDKPVTAILGAFYDSNIQSISLPESLSFIGNKSFFSCGNLKSIHIPDNVSTIQQGAFFYSAISTVNIPKSLTVIEKQVFSYCNLKKVVIPDNITTIGEEAFSNSALSGITISDSVTKIGRGAFESCNSLTDITLPSGITTIPDAMYYSCDNLINITIPEHITEIGSYAFSECYNLVSVNIPDSVTKIGSDAFSQCEKLRSINLPNSITTIEKTTFFNCDSLTSITLPDNLTSIEEKAFFECDEIKSIKIPEKTTTIGSNAFADCRKLLTVTVPDSVVSIQPDSFYDYTILLTEKGSYAHSFADENSTLYFLVTDGEETSFVTVDGITYIVGNSETAAIDFDGKTTDVIVPASIDEKPVTGILGAFENSKITSIKLPDTIRIIGRRSFYGCYCLSGITIPDGVTTIGSNAFTSCSFQSLIIPDSVTAIKSQAFCNSSIASIKLPAGITEIEDEAFYYNEALTSIIIPEKVKKIGYRAFYRCTRLSNLTLPDELETIESGAFYYCYKLNNLTIPGSVTELGDAAFANCTSLTDITIPGNLVTIGGGSFSDCTSLTSLVVPDGVEVIGNNAFGSCYNLVSITMPDSITSIGAMAFYQCYNIKDITIPDNVTFIGKSAFSGCRGFTDIKIPANVTTIEDSAFDRCVNLTDLNISYGVSSIGSGAFDNCDKLESVMVPDSVSEMKVDSFDSRTILIVKENSFVHSFAKENDLAHFVIQKTGNPEVNYGLSLSGTVTDTDSNPVSGATVEIIYDNGTVKETVKTDDTGKYKFTYAEVGSYTIRATDSNANTASEVVSVKRMNAFDVFLTGTTDLILKTGYTVSGTVSDTGATVTITDINTNIVATTYSTDNAYTFENIPNGTYIIKAETDTGCAYAEIHVFGSDTTVKELIIPSSSATIIGNTEIENRDNSRSKKVWVNITLYNSEGNPIAQTKTDTDGKYVFKNVPLDEYTIVAEAEEMRPDKNKKFLRNHKLTGYGYVIVDEAKEFTAETIVLYEESESVSELSGKITAKGETQNCEVTLTNVFRNEIANVTTGKNGKYRFINIPDGLYFVTATTQSDGMGFVVVMVRNGQVFGNTDIKVEKSDRVYEHENNMNSIPQCNTLKEALEHKDKIVAEKNFYDSLPEKEKKQLSRNYIERLNRLSELIAQCSYEKPENIEIENGGTIVSGDEINNEDCVEFVLSINRTDEFYIPDDGIKTNEEFIQQEIYDAAGDKHIAQYYDITLTKNGTLISEISKNTDTTGKLRITMMIPEEHRGHKHYTFVHIHNGMATTLVDLDDAPDTVTFEVDRFSTFALCYSDIQLIGSVDEFEDNPPASISYDTQTGKINVSSAQTGTLYIATYDNKALSSVDIYDITAHDDTTSYPFNTNQAAFIWDSDLQPLCEKFTIDAEE